MLREALVEACHAPPEGNLVINKQTQFSASYVFTMYVCACSRLKGVGREGGGSSRTPHLWNAPLAWSDKNLSVQT